MENSKKKKTVNVEMNQVDLAMAIQGLEVSIALLRTARESEVDGELVRSEAVLRKLRAADWELAGLK